jgi:thiol-disulfide isomerase/thioredoxin
MKNNLKFQFLFIAISFLIFSLIGFLLYKFIFKKAEEATNYALPPAAIERITPPQAIPKLEVLSKDGKKITINDHKGKILVINFWASWCEPCIKELPALAKLPEMFGDENLKLFAVSIDENKSIPQLQEFLDDIELKNLDFFTDKNLKSYESLDALGLPTTLVIDRESKLFLRVSGFLNWQDPTILNLFNEIP